MPLQPAARKDDEIAASAGPEARLLAVAVGAVIEELIPKPNLKSIAKALIKKNPIGLLVSAGNIANKVRKHATQVGKAVAKPASVFSNPGQWAQYKAARAYSKAVRDAPKTASDFAVGQLFGFVKDPVVDFAESIGVKYLGFGSDLILKGSHDVFTNKKDAARVDDPTKAGDQIAQGSDSVSINKKPASRAGDKTKKQNIIVDASDNVWIGGDPTTVTKWTSNEHSLEKAVESVAGAVTKDGVTAKAAAAAAKKTAFGAATSYIGSFFK
jgi:uncharacterized Zn-binding protein involved in type VI secretion